MVMRTRVKICCIGSQAEADMAVAAGADALGLLATMPSGSGMISDALIAAIARRAPPPVGTILLTAETTADGIAAHLRATRTSAVQVVTPIEPREAARLAELAPHTRRIQVVHVEGPEALEQIGAFAPHIHAFLLDSGSPSAPVPELGGTGRTHDWDVSAAFVRASPLPVFLAGGLNAGNVGDAIARVQPFGLDLYSGVRTAGALDEAKLGAFMAAVRNADLRGSAA